MKGIFITFEGADGSGKTTQIELLKKYFSQQGFECVLTREPGGTEISEAIRSVILDPQYSKMCHTTEMLLYAASRAQHVEEVIVPSLLEGKVVICDRFVDSSAIYQGIGRGIGVDRVYQVNDIATNHLTPDLTILLDIDAEIGIKRKKNQAVLDRLEMEKIDFHKKVAAGYRALAKTYKDRIYTVNAARTVQEIHDDIIHYIQHNHILKGE